MPLLRNTNPLGWIDVPEIGREGDAPAIVCGECADDLDHDHTDLHAEATKAALAEKGVGALAPGETFECSDEIAELLLEQVGNFELAEPVKTTKKKEA